VTRKKFEFAFDSARFGAKKNSSRVAAWNSPIAANSDAIASVTVASARGIQSGNGERASVPSRTANGSRKKTSTSTPARG
jgi:hypothetical protein